MRDWGNRVLVAAVATLMGGSIAAGAMWLTVAQTYVTKAEVRHMIAVESPYVQDQKWLGERLSRLERKVDEVLRRLPK